MGLWRRLLLKKLGATQFVPFTFKGYEDSPVFIHPCGTVIDVVPGSDTLEDVEQGNCDCENVAPWLRIYVRRES